MIPLPYQNVLSGVAIALTLMAFVPYIRAIARGTVRPHVFSWVIWATTTFVVFLAQLKANAGVGAWPIGVSAGITGFIATLAYARRADVGITRSDWVFLVAALSSLPLWYFTADPLWAVAVLTAVDVLGFGPTIRKAYYFPHSESLPFFALFATRNVLVVLALEHQSVTTVLFPATIAAACLALMALITVRRRTVPA